MSLLLIFFSKLCTWVFRLAIAMSFCFSSSAILSAWLTLFWTLPYFRMVSLCLSDF